jgi:splicing factor 3A subunit 1
LFLEVIDTTSSHVAKGGIQLEQMLKENNKAHSKLSFLYSTDPYHTYYQHMVSKFRSGGK